MDESGGAAAAATTARQRLSKKNRKQITVTVRVSDRQADEKINDLSEMI